MGQQLPIRKKRENKKLLGIQLKKENSLFEEDNVSNPKKFGNEENIPEKKSQIL